METKPDTNLQFTLLYGAWGVEQQKFIRRLDKKGKEWFAVDLGYWGRIAGDFAVRLTYNCYHPTVVPMPKRDCPIVTDDYNKDGPVIIVGCGKKSCNLTYQTTPNHWERIQADKYNQLGKEVVFRPKLGAPRIVGYTNDRREDITDVLRGASLVVTRHSNVGVDAIRQGIPVVTEDGAAKTLQGLRSQNERQQFINNLSWWNWRPSEIKEFWKHVLMLAAAGKS